VALGESSFRRSGYLSIEIGCRSRTTMMIRNAMESGGKQQKRATQRRTIEEQQNPCNKRQREVGDEGRQLKTGNVFVKKFNNLFGKLFREDSIDYDCDFGL
jgi:hypothetical protein